MNLKQLMKWLEDTLISFFIILAAMAGTLWLIRWIIETVCRLLS